VEGGSGRSDGGTDGARAFAATSSSKRAGLLVVLSGGFLAPNQAGYPPILDPVRYSQLALLFKRKIRKEPGKTKAPEAGDKNTTFRPLTRYERPEVERRVRITALMGVPPVSPNGGGGND
jgi:hypothetical protein